MWSTAADEPERTLGGAGVSPFGVAKAYRLGAAHAWFLVVDDGVACVRGHCQAWTNKHGDSGLPNSTTMAAFTQRYDFIVLPLSSRTRCARHSARQNTSDGRALAALRGGAVPTAVMVAQSVCRTRASSSAGGRLAMYGYRARLESPTRLNMT